MLPLVVSTLAGIVSAAQPPSTATPGLHRDLEFAKVGDQTLTLDAFVPEGDGPFPACRLPPVSEEPDEVDTLNLDQVEVKSYVGGLINSFERRAA